MFKARFCVPDISRVEQEKVYESLVRAMEYMELNDWKTNVIGFGCDGVSANINEGGLKEILTSTYHGFSCFGVLLMALSFLLKMNEESTLTLRERLQEGGNFHQSDFLGRLTFYGKFCCEYQQL